MEDTACLFFFLVAISGLLNKVGLAPGLYFLLLLMPKLLAKADSASKQSALKSSLSSDELAVASQLALVLCTCLVHSLRRAVVSWELEQANLTVRLIRAANSNTLIYYLDSTTFQAGSYSDVMSGIT